MTDHVRDIMDLQLRCEALEEQAEEIRLIHARAFFSSH